jgi:hypothetical protein
VTYETDELSIQYGAPVELYTFTRGGVVIGRYTSGEADVTVDGDTYSTYPGGLARGEISISGERGRAALRITVARDHPVASLIHLRPRTGVIGCTVSRYHRGDDTDVIVIYAGRVLSARRRTRVGTREIVVEPRSSHSSASACTGYANPGATGSCTARTAASIWATGATRPRSSA